LYPFFQNSRNARSMASFSGIDRGRDMWFSSFSHITSKKG
jgi:hypothetical protein